MIDDELWQDFLAHRKAIKRPLTEGAARRLKKRLEGMLDTHDVERALENSMECGWAGCLQPWWDNTVFKRTTRPREWAGPAWKVVK